MTSKNDAELRLLEMDLNELNEEIQVTQDYIQDLSQSVLFSSKDSPAPGNPEDLQNLITRKLRRFDDYIELCKEESRQKAHLSSLLQENSRSLNPYKLPNSIISEKFEISAKSQRLQAKIRAVEDEILEHRSKIQKFWVPRVNLWLFFGFFVAVLLFFKSFNREI